MDPIHFDLLLTPEGWRRDVTVAVAAGRVSALTPGRSPGATSHRIGLPGLPNLHSHAFQRGMAGLAETRGPGPDSFWSWRDVMYRFALAMTGDNKTCTMPNLPAPSDPNRLVPDPDRAPALFEAIIEDETVPRAVCTPTGRARQ